MNKLQKSMMELKVSAYISIVWFLCITFCLIGVLMKNEMATYAIVFGTLGWTVGRIISDGITGFLTLRHVRELEKLSANDHKSDDQQ